LLRLARKSSILLDAKDFEKGEKIFVIYYFSAVICPLSSVFGGILIILPERQLATAKAASKMSKFTSKSVIITGKFYPKEIK